ncbi:Putative LOC100176859, partial [Caligus rogercresseyi]
IEGFDWLPHLKGRRAIKSLPSYWIIMMLPWILLLLLAHDDCLGELTLGETSDVESLVSDGKLQYELIKSNAKLPQYGKCWLSALEFLHNGCGSLTDEIQSRIALKFANCFLEKAGLNTYACPEEEPIRECLRNVDHNAFTSYNGFFMQARSISGTRPQRDGYRAGRGSFSKEMQEVQSKNLEFQRSMMENGTALSHALEASRTNVRDMLSEFRSSTDEQRSMIFEIFDRVSQLQNLVLSEVSWIYVRGLLWGSLLFVYVLTATKRTAEARLWMLLIISINFGIERAVTSGSLPANGDFVAQIRDDLSTRLYERVWNVRKVCSLLFQRLYKINNKLLEDIQKQNLELRQLMESHRLDLTQSSSETKLPSLQSHEFSSCHTRDCFDDEEDQEDNADTSSLDRCVD